MKHPVYATVFGFFFLAACASDDGSDCAREVELLKKELELTKKELELKEGAGSARGESGASATGAGSSGDGSGVADPQKNKAATGAADAAKGQADPKWVVQQVIRAAKTRNFDLLAGLCDPQGKGDATTQSFCNIRSAPGTVKEEFTANFRYSQVVGKTDILKDMAGVRVMYGPKGNQPRIMKLVNRGGKWYLSSLK